MKKISITEAQNHLSELIDTVEQGEDVHLTRHDKPVAVLISEECYQQLASNSKQVFNAIMQWRDQYQNVELSNMVQDAELEFNPSRLKD